MSYRNSNSVRSASKPRVLLGAVASAALAALTACGGGDGTPEAAGTFGAESVQSGAGLQVDAAKVKTVFVDAAKGDDANTGASAKTAVRTIGRALKLAVAGDKVKLAAGTYSPTKNGEQYPLQVPAGISIVGSLASGGVQGTFLAPASSAAHTPGLVFAGSGTLRDVELDVFGTAVTTSAGAQTFDGVTFMMNGVGLQAGGSARSTLQRSKVVIDPNGVNKGVVAAGQAAVVVDAGSIEGLSQNCTVLAAGITAGDASEVTMKNGVNFLNVPGHAIELRASAKATITSAILQRQNADSCKPAAIVDAAGSSVFNATAMQMFTFGGQSAVGLAVRESAAVTLTNPTISGNQGAGSGLSISNGASDRHVVVNGGAIKANGVGIEAGFTGVPHIDLSKVRIEGNVFGMNVLTPALTMKESSLSNNQVGVQIKGALDKVAGAAIHLDGPTGTGDNTIVGNAITGVSHFGTGVVFAGGNLWNPAVQVMDFEGRPLLGSTARFGDFDDEGTNYRLVQAGQSIKF